MTTKTLCKRKFYVIIQITSRTSQHTEQMQGGMMSKNICRLDGNQIFLSVLRDDDEAVGLYAKWMSDEITCVFIEHAHSVVDITRMPGWISDHSVMRMGIVLKETDTLIGYCHIDHRTDYEGESYRTDIK